MPSVREQPKGDALDGRPSVLEQESDVDEQRDENIFLFLPNLIGT